jgi:hypothetical protein
MFKLQQVLAVVKDHSAAISLRCSAPTQLQAASPRGPLVGNSAINEHGRRI